MAETSVRTNMLVHEAVICSLSLGEVGQQQAAEAGLKAALDCQSKLRDVLTALSGSDFSRMTREEIASITPNLFDLARRLLSFARSREELTARMPEPFRDAYGAVLSDLEISANRIEDAAEGWALALDSEFVSEVREAIDSSRLKPGAERDWREGLARI
jgi:hypothetical protein